MQKNRVNIASLNTTVEDGFCVPDCAITSTGTNLVLESRMRKRSLSGNPKTVSVREIDPSENIHKKQNLHNLVASNTQCNIAKLIEFFTIRDFARSDRSKSELSLSTL